MSTAKVFRPTCAGRKTPQIIRCRCLRRRRSVDVDIRLALRLCRRSRRRIYNRSVALLFLAGRVCYCCFLLLTSRQKRGTNEEADVFVHVGRTDSDADYLRCWRRTRSRSGLSRGASGRFGGSACRRGGRFSFLFASREKRGAGQDANVFLHNVRSSVK